MTNEVERAAQGRIGEAWAYREFLDVGFTDSKADMTTFNKWINEHAFDHGGYSSYLGIVLGLPSHDRDYDFRVNEKSTFVLLERIRSLCEEWRSQGLGMPDITVPCMKTSRHSWYGFNQPLGTSGWYGALATAGCRWYFFADNIPEVVAKTTIALAYLSEMIKLENQRLAALEEDRKNSLDWQGITKSSRLVWSFDY